MSDHLFVDKKEIPTQPALRKTLGAIYVVYEVILKLTEAYSHEWKFYGKTLGWQLKAVHKGKALFYLIPLDGAFRIAFAVRENEKRALLDSNLPFAIKEQLKSAKKYPEGYPLRLEIGNKSDMQSVRTILTVLIQHRG
jgi:hypothetical protein